MLRSLFLILFVSLTATAFSQTLPVRVLEKPVPDPPSVQGEIQGTVVLKAAFLKDGKIGGLAVISRLPYLTDLALAAAAKVKFEPKIVDGSPVDSVGTLSYSFSEGRWLPFSRIDPKADDVVKLAVLKLGGDKYLNVRTQVGKGLFSVIREGGLISHQNFTDVIVFPDRERTDFKGVAKVIQVNEGKTGWVFDGNQNAIKDQSEEQIANFRRGLRVSLDYLLRGAWRADGGTLAYVGRRAATLGKRNDVLKLSFDDGFSVEFEFAVDDATPAKAIYKRSSSEGQELVEEDRYGQFVEFSGVRTPLIIDRFTNGVQSSRINYESVEFNKSVPDSIFRKPANAKSLKKDIGL